MKKSILRSRSGVIALLVVGALVALTVVAVGRVATHGKSIATLRAPSLATKVSTSQQAGAPTIGENEANESGIIRARDKWFFHQRAFPAAHTPQGALLHATRQARALKADRLASAPTTAIGWTLRGPKPIATIGPDAAAASGIYGGSLPLSGRISAIAPDPYNANVAYIGGANGGVWKTTNGYGSPVAWAPKFANNNASFSIGAIAVDKSSSTCAPAPSSCRIWAGTGEANGSGDTYYGQGIYRSVNAGATWTKASGTLFNGCFISDLAIVNANTIVAAVLEFPGVTNPACPITRRGVWRTANALATTPTWTKITLPSSAYQAPADFTQPPTLPTTIFLGTYIDGVYRSTNGGLTWTKIATAAGLYRPAISAYNANIVYVVYSGGSSGSAFGGVRRTLNGSAASPTFATVVPPASSNSPCTYPGGIYGQCSYDITLAVDPTNYTRFFVGGIRMYRYTNSGAVGTPIGYGSCAGCIHVDQHATVFDKLNHLWQGSDGGMYRTDNLGASFVNRNGTGAGALAITEYNGWTSGSFAAGVFLGGTQDNGTTKYTTATGLNWRMDHGGDGGASAFVSPSAYFASYYGPSIYRTLNGGGTYTKISSATIDGQGSEFYPPLESAASATTLYRGTTRVWRGTNTTGAVAWKAISPIFTGTVSAIGVRPVAAPNDVYAAWDASTSQMRYTHNATAVTPTWSNSGGLPNRYITDIHVNPANGLNAIATLSGFGTPHVYRTTNGGASWTPFGTTGMPNTPANAVAVDYTHSPARIFVGTDIGVYWSVDGGVTWGNTSVGLPNTTVMDLRIAGGLLIAATHGRSVYSAPRPS